MSILLRDLPEKFKVTPNSGGATKAKTPEFLASYANVFEAKETPSGDLKFSICMIFSKDNAPKLKPVVQAIVNAAAKKFGNDHTKWPKTLKCPLRDGDEERDGKEYENTVFMNAGNKNQPGVIDRTLAPLSADEFYSGCQARATLSFYPFDAAGNKGVGCGLNNVLKIADGERLDSYTSAEDDFAEDVEEITTSEAETETENTEVF